MPPIKLTVYALLAVSAALAAVAQLMFKVGASGKADFWSFLNFWIFGGLCCYAVGTIIWIYSLSKAPLNIVYPFTALTFVFVFALSSFVLGEATSMRSLLGVTVILLGIYIIASGS